MIHLDIIYLAFVRKPTFHLSTRIYDFPNILNSFAIARERDFTELNINPFIKSSFRRISQMRILEKSSEVSFYVDWR